MHIFDFIKAGFRPLRLVIDNARLIYDTSVLPNHMFLECMIANNSQKLVSITKIGILLSSGEECCAKWEADIKFGEVQMADDMPVAIQPNEAKRLVFEFEYNDEIGRLVSQVQQDHGDKVTVKIHTNCGMQTSTIHVSFANLEDWLWKNKERKAKT